MSWPAIIFLALSSIFVVGSLVRIGAAKTATIRGAIVARIARELTLLFLAYLGGLFA